MKVGIITIHNVSNYGAVLQAYALKELIKTKYDVSIIDYDNRHVSKSLDYVRFGASFHSCLGTVKDIFRIIPRMRVIPKFKRFISEDMDIVPYNTDQVDKFSTLISGSDQIWNPACVSSDKTFIPEYFLSFATPNQNKIAYASSCGAYQYSSAEETVLGDYLGAYDALSTRESKTSKYLSSVVGREVEHVLDPTLLLQKDEWLDRLSDNNFREGDYILLYVIKKTPLLKKVINKLKNELNAKVILCEQGLHFDSIVDEHIRDAGPRDFISLFNNAKFVVTDSFHGTTFSLTFNKPFFSVSPGANVNRISSLLEVVGLDSRIIHDEDSLKSINSSHYTLDFSEANERLDAERQKSKDYLFSNLEM
ncbi:polysaccharide pyruvyl transferase family protein [Vibrio sp. ZSDZ34]|uniref:Polysaccharide pyruvyl transferase family protein n=1 Tax=Vibrio gelatinilyticus TaxID=2893468 RepID=A0A9X1WKR6_9VIBR|nr:polysaccharide pyruvyl transferase family protein [Vibrio gelatinilyticus]MCJ2378629.1 polysaccharide pyruvyl transferase family protein [Vibrio gelatinilyticus]